MPFINIQKIKLNTNDICDFLISDLEEDLFIQIEMKNYTYHKIKYKKREIEQFQKDVKKVEKILVKACHLTRYNERKCA
jgi:ribosomal protein S18 acetylase RimI-like enzyme